MTKEKFLKKLEEALHPLEESQRRQILSYYEEIFLDAAEAGQTDEVIAARLGDPQKIARQVLTDAASEQDAPLSTTDNSEKVWSAPGTVTTVVVDAQDVRVRVVPAGQGPVRFRFTPTHMEVIDVQEANGVFTLTHHLRAFARFGVSLNKSPEIVLELPVKFSGSLQLRTSNARLLANGPWALTSARFLTKNASIELSRLKSAQLFVKTSNAHVSLISVSGESCTVETSNGKIQALGASFPQQLSLRTSNESICLENALSNVYAFKTSNARIEGSLDAAAHDYTIISHTSNAKNNLPTDWPGSVPGKTLSAVTSNARIQVQFLK